MSEKREKKMGRRRRRWGDPFHYPYIHRWQRELERESVRVPEVVKVVVDLKPITALHYLPFSSLVWLTPGGKGMVGGTWDEIKRRGLIKEI